LSEFLNDESAQAGVCMHLTSLPGPHGIGDIADSALSFIDTLVPMGIGVWQFLPTGPTAFGNSPYQPLSAFAGNELLIGMEPLVRLGLLSASEAETLNNLPADYVDYEALGPQKKALLTQAAERFARRAGGALKSGYEEFLHLHEKNWLNDYALFRVLKSQHGERAWPEWNEAYTHREQVALQRVADQARDAIERIKIIQFLYQRQWQKLRRYAAENTVCLFADMPIYIALDSADAWAQPEMLNIDREGQPTHVAGVPPDYFSEDGQLWGNPLYDWDYHSADGYTWWTRRMQHASNRADLIRIDHFRGFESYWSVPCGSETAKIGKWAPGPGTELFDAVSESLGRLPIIAENLGVITDEVEALRKHYQIPGMKVLQLELGNSDFVLEDIEENCVCYTGTHDNDTTLGWFNGSCNDTRTEKEFIATQKNALRLTGGKAKTIHRDMIRSAFASKARLAVAPMQDFLGLGSEARLNTPGTTGENWRWRLAPGQAGPSLRDSVREMVEESSRCSASQAD